MQDMWQGELVLGKFPKLWSWSSKVQEQAADRWCPVQCIYDARNLPKTMPLSSARWLCSSEHMTDSVKAAFGGAVGELQVPKQVGILELNAAFFLQHNWSVAKCDRQWPAHVHNACQDDRQDKAEQMSMRQCRAVCDVVTARPARAPI